MWGRAGGGPGPGGCAESGLGADQRGAGAGYAPKWSADLFLIETCERIDAAMIRGERDPSHAFTVLACLKGPITKQNNKLIASLLSPVCYRSLIPTNTEYCPLVINQPTGFLENIICP